MDGTIGRAAEAVKASLANLIPLDRSYSNAPRPGMIAPAQDPS